MTSWQLPRQSVRFSLAALVVLGLFAQMAVAAERNMLWQFTKGAQSGYLLGSIHFGSEDLYPLADPVMAAYADSDVLVVEINLLEVDQGALAQRMLADGMYTDLKHNLQSQLSETTWQSLTEIAPQFGLPVALVQRQKPWLVALTLTALAAQKAGYREDLGIDIHFLELAKPDKEIVELESVTEQIGLFANLDAREQEAFLAQTLDELSRGPAFFEQMFSAWKSGDSARVDAVINESLRANPAFERLERLLLSDRNETMFSGVQALLEQGRKPMVVVGAGHMVGDRGLVALMRQQGFQVEQQ